MSRVCVLGEADPFLARLLARFAEESGLAVVRAAMGPEVVALAQRLGPAVIVVDIELPGAVRGWEAVRALKGEARTAGIPVIACTWLSEAEAEALAGEVAAHLRKPDLHYEDFAAALRAAGVELSS